MRDHHANASQRQASQDSVDIAELCRGIAAAYETGSSPKIEDVLATVPESERPKVFREILVMELRYRAKRGESPTYEEYAARFPEQAQFVVEAFHQNLPEVSIASTQDWRRSAADTPSRVGDSRPPVVTKKRLGRMALELS